MMGSNLEDERTLSKYLNPLEGSIFTLHIGASVILSLMSLSPGGYVTSHLHH